MNKDFLAGSGDVGKRIDAFMTEAEPDLSRSALQKLITDGHVLVNGSIVAKNYKLRPSDNVSLELPMPKEISVSPENIPIDIVYEDIDLLVVNKQKGMVVHPAAGNYTGTLVNALLWHCKGSLSGINGEIRPGIVHRIDKDTSGLLIVAKNDKAHSGLATQIKEHTFLREYEAIVHGVIKDNSGTIDLPIGRHKTDRKKMCVTDQNSRNAVTHYEVINRYDGYTQVRLRLETGRTHQIRVHMAYMGFPIAGDNVYGHKKEIKSLQGQCLHAKSIGFVHPVTGKELYFTSELPLYFSEFIKKISRNRIEGMKIDEN